MKIYLLLIASLFGSFGLLNAQQNNFWLETSENVIPSEKSPKLLQQPLDARYFKLNIKELKKSLKNAPMEYTKSSKELVLSFPLANGTVEDFIVSEAPVMAPKLAAKYPNIKSYRGIGKSNPLHSIRFDYSPVGFHGSVHTQEGKIYIDPFTNGNSEYCVVYNTNDMTPLNDDFFPDLGCGVKPDYFEVPDSKEKLATQAQMNLRSVNTPVLVKVYRLALACTGEYAEAKGGTLESVNASYVTAINRVNQVFELEVAVKMELIENNDNLIFLNGDTDPYTNPTLGTGLLGQNLPVFVTAGVATASYDVGHVFTIRCTDVGGVASGQVCTDGKMRGVTCHYSTNIEAIAVDVMTHEIGHQFSCGHSWDNCPSSAQQRAGGSAYEPGSGTTIMSYAGSCGDQNIVNAGDDYYNIGSLESFIGYSRDVVPNCGEDVPNGNNYPVLSLDYEDGFYIPTSTPFELTATASDEDGDPITYCWEQHDSEVTASDIGSPLGNAPLFRSRRPTTDPNRMFPSKNAVLANSFNNTEVMPTYERDMSFFCTVRDNVADGGGTIWEEVNFKVDGESGPFRLSFPSSLEHKLSAGTYQEITWDPANSQNAPVNCQTVNIILSYDNADTFVDTLAIRAKNDGSHFVDIPEELSNIARIKIEAADNIFFDFSNNRIEILEATTPTFSLGISPEFQEICAPAVAILDVASGSVLEYSDNVELSVVGDVPAYVSNINFSNNSLIPGEGTSIEVQIDEPGVDTVLSLTIQAVSENADTTYRTVELNVYSNDFSSLTLEGPLDGASGLVGVPDFVWSATATAQDFTFELATNPSFSAETIIIREDNLTEGNYQLEQVIEPTTLYYWRVTPSGRCGAGQSSEPFAFHSASINCQQIEAEDLPIAISASFSGDLFSKINVPNDGTISDINITNITGTHTDFSDLSFSIISPSGTIVKLVSNKCSGMTGSFDMAFDQQSPFDFTCPPRNVFVPAEDLDVLAGEDIKGLWEFVINDRTAQFGGRIESWSLEFCSSIALDPPTLVRNNVLDISSDYEKVIDNNKLRVEDANNLDWELKYTMATAPEDGQLLNEGVALNIGETFTQSDLNAGKISYKSNVTVGTSDNFLFTVVDGDGGWTGTHRFNINFVDVNVSTNEINTLEVEVMPNPVRELLYVKTNSQFSNAGTMEVYNLQGQLISKQSINGFVKETINTSAFGNGIYFLKIQDEKNISTTKFVVEN